MAASPAVVLETLERSSLKAVSRPVLLPKPKIATCAEIEAALGSKLPPSARKFAGWWKTVTPEKGQGPPTQVWVLPRR
jgi:hypothetical protein